MKQIYHCSACRYTFEAEPYENFPARCPDCGKFEVRPADEAEIEEYKKVQHELLQDEALTSGDADLSSLPNYRTREEVEAALREQGYDLTHKAFYATVKGRFGSRGLRQAQQFMEQQIEGLRTPDASLSNCALFLAALQSAFICNKTHAQEKYTPKKHRKAPSDTLAV